MRYNLLIQTRGKIAHSEIYMLTFEATQEAISNFKKVIAEKGVYSSHIPALVAKLEKLIYSCSFFVFNPEIISKVDSYRITLNTQNLLKYADEKLYSNVGLEWLNRNMFDVTIEGKLKGNFSLHIQPRYLFNSNKYVKPIDLSIKRLLEVYALSERNEQVSFKESVINKVHPWKQHNPYIDDDLAQLQDEINQGVIYAGNKKDVQVGDEVKNIPADAKYLVFILVDAILHSIESIKINKDNTGLEHIVNKPLYGKTLTNSGAVKAENKDDASVILSILNVSDEKFKAIIESSFRSPHYSGLGVDDWLYFRSHGGTKLVYSPSLGVNRMVNTGEFYNLSSFN